MRRRRVADLGFHLLATFRWPRARRVIKRGSVVAPALLIYLAIGSLFLSSNNAQTTAITANLWVNTTAGTCTRSSSPVAYNSVTACGSFDAAYVAANPGDSVLVRAGTYAAQAIPAADTKAAGSTCEWNETFGDGTSTTKNLTGCISFAPTNGTVDVNGNLIIQARYVLLNGITLDTASGGNTLNLGFGIGGYGGSCSAIATSQDIIENDTAPILIADIGGSHVYFVGGSYGGSSPPQSNRVSGCYDSTNYTPDTYVAFDGTTFHDIIQTANGQHLECLHWFDGADSIIINSKFLNCAQLDLSLQLDGGINGGAAVSAVNFTAYNDVFDAVCSQQTLDINSGLCSGAEDISAGCSSNEPNATTGYLFSFDSFGTGIQTQTGGGSNGYAGTLLFQVGTGASATCFSGGKVYGTAQFGTTSFNCGVFTAAGVTWSYNVYASSYSCGSNGSSSNTIASMFTSESGQDYRPPVSAPELAFVTSGSGLAFPATDLLGNARAYPVTAGAYENHA